MYSLIPTFYCYAASGGDSDPKRWKGDGVGIAGATNNTYTLDIADLGKQITVDVVPSYNGVAKNNGGLTSAPTAAVADSAQNIANNISGTVAITGLAKVGENLTADITGLPNQPGMTYAYEIGIGGSHISCAPATPPGMRVRTGRFEKLRS